MVSAEAIWPATTLAGLARTWLPSYVIIDGRREYQSEKILEDADSTLAPTVKDELRKHLKLRFDLNLSDSKIKAEAFYLCRTALTLGKVGSYVEQY